MPDHLGSVPLDVMPGPGCEDESADVVRQRAFAAVVITLLKQDE
jgi:hypothetical protein